MAIYSVVSSWMVIDNEWSSNKANPTFYLDGREQGITNIKHAERIARLILIPPWMKEDEETGVIHSGSLKVRLLVSVTDMEEELF